MTDHLWLILRLEAPLAAFGGVAIDHVGITRDFPAASMMTGLLANALGLSRTQRQEHQDLQDRLIFAARFDRESPSGLLTDTQNAQLDKSDRGWTTWGTPEGRSGSSYGAPHRRLRDYHPDACVIVALRLEPRNVKPDLEMLAAALERPARPLCLGRKSCLPAAPLSRREFVEAPNAYTALQQIRPQDDAASRLRAIWPLGEGPLEGKEVHRIVDLADLRNWRTGLHGGTRRIVEGTIMPDGMNA